MAHLTTGSVGRQIESLFDGSSVVGLTDRQLVERFTTERDAGAEVAFTALVARHGPMVLGICRQILGDRHDAEDAFQAAFLVLACKARSIRTPALVGSWLHGVAIRTARRAKVRLDRRRRNEKSGATGRPVWRSNGTVEPTVRPAEEFALALDEAEALHDEIDRLPRNFRLTIVLCYFEGLTLDEAAQRLRWPKGTVGSRLARARDKLRRELTRRGIALPAAAMAVALSPRSLRASVSSALSDATIQAAIPFAAGRASGAVLAASAAGLAREVLNAMLARKLRATILSSLLLATIVAGVGYLGRSIATAKDDPRLAARSAPPVAAKPDGAARPAAGRMSVVGRVLDPDGKPFAGAVVDVITRFRAPNVGADDESKPWLTLLGQGRSDGGGRFQLDAVRTATSRVFKVYALAAAPGYGLGWAELDPDADQQAAEIRLSAEQPFRVRVVDVVGVPARDLEVQVMTIGRRRDNGSFDGVSISGIPPDGIRTWPRTAKTDQQGRIVLTGIGRGLGVTLVVRDLRYARQDLRVDPVAFAAHAETTIALQPAQIIEGRVLAADTGKPIPNVVVSASTRGRSERAATSFTAKFRADEHGRFTMNPIAGESITLGAFPAEGEPYLIQQDVVKWPNGAVKMDHDIKVRRGVLIRGKVTEQGTGRLLPASSIQFVPVEISGGSTVLSGWQAIVASRDDGSFQVAVPPGKGHLLVVGSTDDYVLGEIGSNTLRADRPGGRRMRAHAIIPYEVKAGDPPRSVAAVLRPGAIVKGRVQGPDGQAVTDAFILTTLHTEASRLDWQGSFRAPVRDGHFELPGLAPDASTRIYVFDPEHQWGATVEVAGKQAGQDLAIRLKHCGQAKGRFVGPDGKPLTKPEALFEFVATPGPSAYIRRTKQDQAELTADADFLANVDRKHYWDDPNTDAEGRFTMISLIPGALYRISDFSTRGAEKGVQIRKEFTVKPGETVELGEILIEKTPG